MKSLIVALLLSVSSAFAQPLTFITLTGAGSLSDTAIRQAAPAIERHTGRQVVVVNMPGANGLVGVRHFMSLQGKADTYLLGNAAIGYLLATGQIDKAPVPVAGLSKSDMVVYTHPAIPSMAALKASELRSGSSSPMMELSVRLFDSMHSTRSTVVGYTQFSQAVTDLAGGRIEYLIAPSGVSSIESVVSAGKIHAVASVGEQFSWNAVFAYPGVDTGSLAQHITAAVSETQFTGVRPFPAGAAGVVEMMQSESALIQKALAP